MSFAKTYRKRPVEIDAVQWTGDNAYGCSTWTTVPASGPLACAVTQCFVSMDSEDIYDILQPHFIERHRKDGATAVLWVAANDSWLPLKTGSWIAKDKLGFYPIADEVFAETYDEVTDADV